MCGSQVFLPWGVAAASAIAERTKKREDRLRAADLSLTYGQMLRYTGRVDEAEKVLEENLAVRKEAEDRRGGEGGLPASGEHSRRNRPTAIPGHHLLKGRPPLHRPTQHHTSRPPRLSP